MKTRIVKLGDDRFIPQRYVPHFLWGGHWEGIQCLDENTFYSFESFEAQLKKCVVASDELARKVRENFESHLFEMELATK